MVNKMHETLVYEVSQPSQHGIITEFKVKRILFRSFILHTCGNLFIIFSCV